MPGRRMYGDLPTLPPQDYWIDTSLKKNSIETPLDSRNFVDMDVMVNIMTSFIDPAYSWESPINDVHHLQWSVSTQRPSTMSDEDFLVLKRFRELVNRKMYTGRLPHNWAHWLFIPPPIPDVEDMRYSIQAQDIAVSLARTAGLAARLTRIPAIKPSDLGKRLEEEFINYNLYMENARLVPIEFSLLKLEELQVKSPEDLLIVNKRLGRLAVDRIPVVERQIRRAA